jgi:hypothetical protein
MINRIKIWGISPFSVVRVSAEGHEDEVHRLQPTLQKEPGKFNQELLDVSRIIMDGTNIRHLMASSIHVNLPLSNITITSDLFSGVPMLTQRGNIQHYKVY